MSIGKILKSKFDTNPSPSMQFELSFFLCCLAVVHALSFLIAVFFHLEDIAIYQMASVILYLFLRKIISAENFIFVCMVFAVETTAQALLYAHYICTTCSSELYLMILVPVSCGVIFTPYSKKQKYVFAVMSLFYTIFTSIFINLIAWYIFDPKRDCLDNVKIQTVYYIFHTVTAFFVMFLIVLFFVKKVSKNLGRVYMEKNKLALEANLDALTGLYNRRKMNAMLEEYLSCWKNRKSEFVIAIGDIDHFKKINDIYGHQVGDHILKYISGVFIRYLREEDVVFRYGGEEFLFVFQKNSENSRKILERIRKNIEENPVHIDENVINLTMTFGFSLVLKDDSIEDIIKRADKNLYIGKNSGRNRVVGDEMTGL